MVQVAVTAIVVADARTATIAVTDTTAVTKTVTKARPATNTRTATVINAIQAGATEAVMYAITKATVAVRVV